MEDESKTIETAGELQLDWSVRKRFLLIVYQEQSSRILELEEGQEIIVGRDPEADLCIDHSRVSRRHTRLWRQKNQVLVEDLGSTNGTRVNGELIEGQARLRTGDEVGVGSASLVLSALSASLGQRRIMSDSELEERLADEVDRARRYHRPMSLAMVRLAGSTETIRRHLALMAQALRRIDLLAAYGPREYTLLLPETDGPAAHDALQRLARPIEQEAGGRMMVGIASCPVDAHSPNALIDAARRRLRQVRRGGPPSSEPLSPTIVTSAAEDRRPQVVAVSRQLTQVLRMARRVGAFDTTVLIMGETGSGKQIVAEEIHRSSPRKKKPLVHLNCAALPPSLLESELFGHERGAFTSADSTHIGHVEACNGGTLFLDEIGELPQQAQPKLLHLLEQQTFTRVGGTKLIQGNVRIITATNRDLEAEVQDGRFRQDLYFRLSAFVLPVPPLRDRSEDIEPLARQFCAEVAASLNQQPPAISERALGVLRRYAWPGNVRQLRNVIERAVVLGEGEPIDIVHLPDRLLGVDPRPRPPDQGTLDAKLGEVEAQIIRDALNACDGNQSEAARRLGITRRALIYRMKKHSVG